MTISLALRLMAPMIGPFHNLPVVQAAGLQADALNGVVEITSVLRSDDNDGASIQGNEIWGLPSTASKNFIFEARFQMTDVGSDGYFCWRL